MIDVRALRRDFGGIHALAGVDLHVAPGERRAVIGPNGAGKTTLFNVLTGELRATSGTMRLGDTDLGSLTTWQRARLVQIQQSLDRGAPSRKLAQGDLRCLRLWWLRLISANF